MKVWSLSCIFLAVAEEVPSNRTLLSARSGRRLANVKCEIEAIPFSYSKPLSNTAAYGAATNDHKCASSAPAVKVTGNANVDDTGDTTAIQNSCCEAEVLCTKSYADEGTTASATQIASCTTTGNKVPSDLYCYTTDGNGNCGSATAASSSDLDKVHCCRQMCTDAGTGGFQLSDGSSTTKKKCADTGGTFQVSKTAYCAGQACANSDSSKCCQKQCTSGFVLFDADKVVADGNDMNCVEGVDRVNPDGFCAGETCTASDASTCCQQKCTDGFELFGGTTKGKLQCDEKQGRVSPDRFCAGPSCKTKDKATCCETKCNKAGAGFEKNGGTTSGMQQCAKDLIVHPTEYCDGTSCSKSAAVCCQQKCSAGFRLKSSTGDAPLECDTDLTVHAEAYCEGATCKASDAGTCCQKSCSKGWKAFGSNAVGLSKCPKEATVASDSKCSGSSCSSSLDQGLCCNNKCSSLLGFKEKGATSSQTMTCPSSHAKVSATAMCKGSCKSSDSSVCCLKANNSSQGLNPGLTNGAKSSSMAILVGALVLIAAASS